MLLSRLARMNMNIEQRGQQNLARAVNNFAILRGRNVLSDLFDLAAFDENVCTSQLALVFRRNVAAFKKFKCTHDFASSMTLPGFSQ